MTLLDLILKLKLLQLRKPVQAGNSLADFYAYRERLWQYENRVRLLLAEIHRQIEGMLHDRSNHRLIIQAQKMLADDNVTAGKVLKALKRHQRREEKFQLKNKACF